MKRIMTLILALLTALLPAAYACEECEGDDYIPATGDLCFVDHCREYISLRAEPSTKSARLAKIPLGETVNVVASVDGSFTHVRWNGQYGFVLSRYLEFYGLSVRYVTGCDKWISLRAAESTRARRLTAIPKGEAVYVGETFRGSGFVPVVWTGDSNADSLLGMSRLEGYSLARYLTLTPFEKGDTLRVASFSAVPIYREPDVTGDAMGRLPAGAEVRVLNADCANGFTRVSCGSIAGYVLSGYLS